MIRRTLNPLLVNRIANDELVRSTMFLGMKYPQYELDFTDVLEDARNHCLVDDQDFLSVFQWTSPETYECHIMSLKSGRGKNAFASGRQMLEYIASRGARTVWGQPSVYNRQAICYIRRMGLTSKGFGHHPIVGDVEYFVKEGL